MQGLPQTFLVTADQGFSGLLCRDPQWPGKAGSCLHSTALFSLKPDVSAQQTIQYLSADCLNAVQQKMTSR